MAHWKGSIEPFASKLRPLDISYHANFDSQQCILQNAAAGHISNAVALQVENPCTESIFNQCQSIHFEKNWITSTWNLKSHNTCSPVASLALGTVHRSRSVHRGGKGTRVTFGIEFLFWNSGNRTMSVSPKEAKEFCTMWLTGYSEVEKKQAAVWRNLLLFTMCP